MLHSSWEVSSHNSCHWFTIFQSLLHLLCTSYRSFLHWSAHWKFVATLHCSCANEITSSNHSFSQCLVLLLKLQHYYGTWHHTCHLANKCFPHALLLVQNVAASLHAYRERINYTFQNVLLRKNQSSRLFLFCLL